VKFNIIQKVLPSKNQIVQKYHQVHFKTRAWANTADAKFSSVTTVFNFDGESQPQKWWFSTKIFSVEKFFEASHQKEQYTNKDQGTKNAPNGKHGRKLRVLHSAQFSRYVERQIVWKLTYPHAPQGQKRRNRHSWKCHSSYMILSQCLEVCEADLVWMKRFRKDV